MNREPIDIVAVLDDLREMASPRMTSGDRIRASNARLALNELLKAGQAIVPAGEPEWSKTPKGLEVGSLGMDRPMWERFVTALRHARGDA